MNWKEVTIRKCTTGYIVTVRTVECVSTVYINTGGYTHTATVEHVFEIFCDVRDYLNTVFSEEIGE